MSESARYLLRLYAAERRADGPVATGALADAVDRSPAATTEMLQRLEARGLVDLEPYDGARLTPDGREAAAQLRDTYRTLARFFDEVLALDDPAAEAMALTGAVSPTVAERLAATLLPDEESASTTGDAPSVDTGLRSGDGDDGGR